MTMMTLQRRHLLIGMAALAAPAWAQTAVADAQDLLRRSDQARGGGLPGLVWEVRATTISAGEEGEPMRLRILAGDDASLAETLEPTRSKGAKMLQAGRNMWLSKPGLKKPVPISPRQRLTGQAAIGDIAATNYARDYDAQWLREDSVDGERCAVLQLTARGKQSTYERIVYWVSLARGLGVKAEFQSLSGKALKTATFDYGNQLSVQGKPIAFISRMQIADALSDARTTLVYERPRVQALATSAFDVDHLE